MKEALDLESTLQYFVKGSSLGLVICSIILVFIHYNFNRYFNFEIPTWLIFIFWVYLIGNSIALFRFLKKDIFECPKCKKKHRNKNG